MMPERFLMARTRQTHRHDRRVLNWVTVLYVASIPFDIYPVDGGRTLTGPITLLLIVTWIISSLQRPEPISFSRSAGTLLFLYLGWSIFTIFWSIDAHASTTALLTLMLRAPMVVILSNVLGRVWLRSLITFGCSTSVLGSLLLTQPADPLQQGRADIAGIDQNVTAMVLAVGFAVVLYLVTHLGGRRAAIFLPLAIVTGTATLHTGSRSGAISVAVLLVVTVLTSIRQEHLRPVTLLRAAGILLLGAVFFNLAGNAGLVPARVGELLNNGGAYQETERAMIIDLYRNTFDHWAFFGVGFGSDASYLQMSEGTYFNAHSLFWETWIETGLVGLGLFLAFLIVVIKRGFHSVASQALILITIPIVVFAYTLGGYFTSTFWFVVALALTPGPSALAADGKLNPIASPGAV